MPKIVNFPADYYDQGAVKFAQGSYHPLNSETQSLVTSGFAELIDTDDGGDHAEALQALADIAQGRADAAMAVALELAEEAKAARALAERQPAGKQQNVQTTAREAAAKLRDTANELVRLQVQSGEAFAQADAASKAKPKDAGLASKAAEAKAADDKLIADMQEAVKAAEAAEQALQA